MDAAQRQQETDALLGAASREHLVEAIRGVLDVTRGAQRPLDVSDHGVGGWRSAEVVDAEYQARSSVGVDVEDAVLAGLKVHR